MSRARVFFLCVFSFFAGFMLREMLIGTANESLVTMIPSQGPSSQMKSEQKPVDSDGPVLEISEVIVPQKVFAGNSFEMIVSVKIVRNFYGVYGLGVSLFNLESKNRFDSVLYRIDANKGVAVNETRKLGPFKVPTLENLPNGVYKVSVIFIKNMDKEGNLMARSLLNVKASYPETYIEVVR